MDKVSLAGLLKYMILNASNRITNSFPVPESPVVLFPLILLMLKVQDRFSQFPYGYRERFRLSVVKKALSGSLISNIPYTIIHIFNFILGFYDRIRLTKLIFCL